MGVLAFLKLAMPVPGSYQFAHQGHDRIVPELRIFYYSPAVHVEPRTPINRYVAALRPDYIQPRSGLSDSCCRFKLRGWLECFIHGRTQTPVCVRKSVRVIGRWAASKRIEQSKDEYNMLHVRGRKL